MVYYKHDNKGGHIMPAIVDRYAVGQSHDKRCKLTEKDKEEIRELYKKGGWSHKTLSERYKVSKSLITIVLNPNRAEKVKNRVKEHWRDYQQHGKEWAETMQKHRRHKKELLEAGEKLPDMGTVKSMTK